MNALSFDGNKNISFKGVNLYVDYVNSRLKILDYTCISENILGEITDYTANEKLGKILSICRIGVLKPFRESGFVVEGTIPGYFKGEDAYCVSYYLDTNRQISKQEQVENNILHDCVSSPGSFISGIDENIFIRDANIKDIPQMITLFKEVFKTYPSPIFSASYLENILNTKTLFKVVDIEGKIISIASAEMDTLNLNAEITDCATYPGYRGKGLLTNLMYQLERTLKEKGFYTLYSLCRAIEPGINKALSKLQYRYTGRLINNCNICGGFEDMNIWIKRLK